MRLNQNEFYWYLVVRSLIEIYKIPPSTARRKTIAYRTDWEDLCKKKRMENLIYHESPVQIASEIAKKELRKSHLIAYQKLEDRPLPKVTVTRLSKKRVTNDAKSRLKRA